MVLVNFWATWCEPCKTEIPWLIEFNDRYGPKGLVILGVAMDDDGKKAVEPFVKNQVFQVNGKPGKMDYKILSGATTSPTSSVGCWACRRACCMRATAEK